MCLDRNPFRLDNNVIMPFRPRHDDDIAKMPSFIFVCYVLSTMYTNSYVKGWPMAMIGSCNNIVL